MMVSSVRPHDDPIGRRILPIAELKQLHDSTRHCKADNQPGERNVSC